MRAATEEAIGHVRAVCLDLPTVTEDGGVASSIGRRCPVLASSVSGLDAGSSLVCSCSIPAVVKTSCCGYTLNHKRGKHFSAPVTRTSGRAQREVGVVINDATDWTEIAELVSESYLIMAPKKLAAEVEAALRRPTNDAT